MNYLDKYSLEGKVAFVTGGLGLLGEEVVKALASAGALTVILDVQRTKGIRLVQQIEKEGYLAAFDYFDLTELNLIEKMVKHLVRVYKGMDIWVNCAYPRTKDWGAKVEDIKLKSLQKNIDWQLNGYTWTSKAVAQTMQKNNIKGSIVNFSSIYGVVGNDFSVYQGTSLTSPMAYSAIKAGIINLGRYLASYYGNDGIRVNTICPGGVENKQPKKFIKQYEQKVPLKRMGQPHEIASATLFLASDASSYVTGSTLMVDGGWTCI
ncbi:MAG: SDR family oxidoreductase [Candidatus Omnitrophica bacterium]|nr:SDR family oxidoreductase [Candidatus Omnitrophota bacterium]